MASIITRPPIPFFGYYEDLFLKHFEHFVLLLFFFPFLQHSHRSPRMISEYARFSILDLVKVLLNVQLAHFLLELLFVSFGGLLT